VSHLLKLGHQDRGDWRRDRKRGVVESQAGADSGAHSGGISKSERGAPIRREEARQVEAQKQPESGPISAGPATADSRCLEAQHNDGVKEARMYGLGVPMPGDLTERDAQQFHVGVL